MTPGTFGPYVLAALPYAGAEALRILAWCTAVTVPAAAAWWLLARAHRLAKPSTPGIRRLHRAAADADDRHAPVTREMDLAGLASAPQHEYALRCRWCHPGGQYLKPGETCQCGHFCGAANCLYDVRGVR